MAAMKVALVLLSALLLANQVRAASIFFPDEEPPLTSEEPKLVFKEAPKCAEFGLCSEAAPEYPTELVRKALGDITNSVLSDVSTGDVIFNVTLGTRFGGSVRDDINLVEETAACTASEAIIYPTMAMNTNHDWMYVANIEGVVVQGIRVERCVDEGRPCKIGEGGTICRQKYIYRKLLVLDATKSIDSDNFRVPSACVCYVKNEFLLQTRFLAMRNGTKTSGGKRSSRRRSRSRRQAEEQKELEFSGGEADGLSGSPLDIQLAGGSAQQGTAQQSVETEETLNPSDTIGNQAVRYAGEIIVESNPIIVQKKPPKSSRRRN